MHNNGILWSSPKEKITIEVLTKEYRYIPPKIW
jgi:hypothetical protein